MLTIFFVAAAHALALSGGVIRSPACAVSRVAPRRIAPTAMVSLPFGGGGSAADSGPSDDVLDAYRTMGLDLDAGYDEIEKSYDALIEQYAKEPKRKIKLQVAKDKILDHLLRQRLSGRSSLPGIIDPFEREEEAKPLVTIPPALQGIMELPEKAYLVKNAFIFAMVGLMPAFLGSPTSSVSIGFAIGLFLLYNRGQETPADPEMASEMRPPKRKVIFKALGITVLSGAIFAAVGLAFFPVIKSILRFATQQLVIGVGSSFGFFVACTLFKVEDDD